MHLSGRNSLEPGTSTVVVRSSARLHFGFLDVTGELGRSFGSVGLSISEPQIEVRAHFGEALDVVGGNQEEAKRAHRYAALFYDHPKVAPRVDGYPFRGTLCLERLIPSHRGLGSGTQLALCVATALDRLHGIGLPVRDRALIVRRGLRSGIGVEAFARGGFVIDAGSLRPGGEIPLPLFRLAFPDEWRVILITPPGVPGMSGLEEENAFASLTPESSSADRVCRIVLMKLLPGLLTGRLDLFGKAVEAVGRITGELFAGFQSGVYASPLADDIFREMRKMGAYGMGQSSWGPTLYAFACDDHHASRIVDRLRRYFCASAECSGMDVTITSAHNVGATIEMFGA